MRIVELVRSDALRSEWLRLRDREDREHQHQAPQQPEPAPEMRWTSYVECFSTGRATSWSETIPRRE
jgi:hypothetical protein